MRLQLGYGNLFSQQVLWIGMKQNNIWRNFNILHSIFFVFNSLVKSSTIIKLLCFDWLNLTFCEWRMLHMIMQYSCFCCPKTAAFSAGEGRRQPPWDLVVNQPQFSSNLFFQFKWHKEQHCQLDKNFGNIAVLKIKGSY